MEESEGRLGACATSVACSRPYGGCVMLREHWKLNGCEELLSGTLELKTEAGGGGRNCLVWVLCLRGLVCTSVSVK